jgi:hypothetical protein
MTPKEALELANGIRGELSRASQNASIIQDQINEIDSTADDIEGEVDSALSSLVDLIEGLKKMRGDLKGTVGINEAKVVEIAALYWRNMDWQDIFTDFFEAIALKIKEKE